MYTLHTITRATSHLNNSSVGGSERLPIILQPVRCAYYYNRLPILDYSKIAHYFELCVSKDAPAFYSENRTMPFSCGLIAYNLRAKALRFGVQTKFGGFNTVLEIVNLLSNVLMKVQVFFSWRDVVPLPPIDCGKKLNIRLIS
jgi:hypothetical protein